MAASQTHVMMPRGIAWPRGLARTIFDRYMDENVGTLAAGIGLFALISLPATLLAIASIYGMVAAPGDVWVHVQWVSRFVPDDVTATLQVLMEHVVAISSSSLTLALAGSVLLAILSAQRSMAATIGALNRIAHLRERRSFWRRQLVALLLTVGGLALALAGITALVALPRLAATLRWEDETLNRFLLLRWPIAFVMGAGYLALLYRFAPCRWCMTWRGAVLGALTASALWVAASSALEIWVTRVSDLHRMYGATASTLIVLLWFYLSALAVLIGGIVAAETRDRGRRAEALRFLPGERHA